MPKKIVVSSENLNRNPHPEGTRTAIFTILDYCEIHGIKGFLELMVWDISLEDLRHAFEYCKRRTCDEDEGYCGGCTLRSEYDKIYSETDYINRFSEVHFLDSDVVLKGTGHEGTMILPGTPEDLKDYWRGQDGWIMAAKFLKEIDQMLEEGSSQ